MAQRYISVWYRVSCRPAVGRSTCRYLPIASLQELVDQPRVGRMPIELGSSLRRVGALIEQEDLGEIVAQPGPSLIVGARDSSRGARGHSGRVGQLGDGRVQSIADDVVAASRVVFQRAPEEVGQVGDVDRRPVLLSRAEPDQVAVVVSG